MLHFDVLHHVPKRCKALLHFSYDNLSSWLIHWIEHAPLKLRLWIRFPTCALTSLDPDNGR